MNFKVYKGAVERVNYLLATTGFAIKSLEFISCPLSSHALKALSLCRCQTPEDTAAATKTKRGTKTSYSVRYVC